MTQIRVRMVFSCELDLDDEVLGMLEIDDDEPPVSQVKSLREFLEEDETNFESIVPEDLKVLAIEPLS